jgi:hypothetical protein
MKSLTASIFYGNMGLFNASGECALAELLRLSHELDKILQASRLQRIVGFPFFADG